MKKLLAALAALSLTGCGPMLTALAGPAPAPLARTTVDDDTLDTLWRAFDIGLDAINVLADARASCCTPGTPPARRIAAAIRSVNRALAAAERFAAAGSTTDYNAALAEARAGIQEIRTVLGGSNVGR